MLPRLLRREWILHRQTLLLMGAIFGTYQIWAILNIDSGRAWLVMATLYAAVLTVALYVREDKFRAAGWSCTLPITRTELVRARFVGSWLLAVAAIALGILLTVIVPGGKVPLAEILEPSTLLIAATLTTLIFAWVLPFTIRFGMMGMMVFLIGGQIAGIVVLLIGNSVNRRTGMSGRPIRAAFTAISDGLIAARDSLSLPLFAFVVVLLLIGANWLIYRFSAYLFLRREF